MIFNRRWMGPSGSEWEEESTAKRDNYCERLQRDGERKRQSEADRARRRRRSDGNKEAPWFDSESLQTRRKYYLSVSSRVVNYNSARKLHKSPKRLFKWSSGSDLEPPSSSVCFTSRREQCQNIIMVMLMFARKTKYLQFKEAALKYTPWQLY